MGTEIYTPLESYNTKAPSEIAYPTPNALKDRFKRTPEPKQTPTSPIESSAPEVATTKLPRETPCATASITPNADPNATDIRAQPTPSATLPAHGKDFTLTILGQQIPVSVMSTDQLAQNPGWLETSAYPGEEGVCVVYGHRNRNHLKVLKDIDFGDTITVMLEDGTMLRYTVVLIKILESDNELRVPLLSGEHIMLTTCYPFYYTGHAPKKFVVIGSKDRLFLNLEVVDGNRSFKQFVLNQFDNDILTVTGDEDISGAKLYRFRPPLLRNIERMCRRGGYGFVYKVLEAARSFEHLVFSATVTISELHLLVLKAKP